MGGKGTQVGASSLNRKNSIQRYKTVTDMRVYQGQMERSRERGEGKVGRVCKVVGQEGDGGEGGEGR